MGEGQISVALLLSDINEVKALTSIFKKLGVIPHFYEDLKTFWQGTLDKIPSLSIIDVKLMSEGDLTLLDHPHVKSEKMTLAFYYTEKTQPLLVSTDEFFHLGLLKKTDNYDKAIFNLLKRVNHLLSLEIENNHLKKSKRVLTETVEKLELEKLIIKNIDQYQSMVKTICLALEEHRSENDFFKSLEKVLQGVEEISEFAILELSFNGQKLISPISHVQKFRAIPSLWLGQVCPRGIENFAQSMATQVAIDIMGGDLVSLLIKGNYAQPDKILFIKSKNELFYNQFDWNMFEAYLNGFYASYKNKLEKDFEVERKINSPFEAMSFIDQFLFGKLTVHASEKNRSTERDYCLIQLDLTSLIEVILKKSNNRFFWNKFEKEFINKLEIQTRIDFRFFNFGVNQLSFIVEAFQLDSFFEELKEFSAKFSFWKYFEESDGVLSQIIHPKVSMVPLSAFAYLKSVQISAVESSDKKNEKAADQVMLTKVKNRELIWGKESINEV